MTVPATQTPPPKKLDRGPKALPGLVAAWNDQAPTVNMPQRSTNPTRRSTRIAERAARLPQRSNDPPHLIIDNAGISDQVDMKALTAAWRKAFNDAVTIAVYLPFLQGKGIYFHVSAKIVIHSLKD